MKETKEYFELRFPNGNRANAGYIEKAEEALEFINSMNKRLDYLGISDKVPRFTLIKVNTTKETDNEGNFQKETQISTFIRQKQKRIHYGIVFLYKAFVVNTTGFFYCSDSLLFNAGITLQKV